MTRPKLLLVDDEERVLRSLAMLLRGPYDVQTTLDPRDALARIERERFNVIVSDQRMPQMLGAQLLREVRQRSPNTLRILLTGYSEMDAVIASVNEGEIFRFVQKPWDARELRETVAQAAGISLSLYAANPLAQNAAAETAVSAVDGAAVLVIDDDESVFASVSDIVAASRPVLWARTLDQALEMLASRDIAIVISELTVGGQSATTLIKLLKAEHPQIVTMVLTPFQDITTFIGLINQGQVFRLLPKPVRRGAFSMSLTSALRHHRMLHQAPEWQAAHRVETLRQPEEISVAGRVMGFLSRMRSRIAAP